ncbi:MAG: hypothetical protein JXL97_15140 [Bacteroidales bacterium]|nr:hypothetical protein [Bacteroidales bacterium]
MRTFSKFFLFFAIFSIVLTLSSCKNGNENNVNNDVVIDTDSLNIQEKINQAKEIFYSLPAPHEVAMFLIQNDDTYFDQELLNTVDHSMTYTTEASQAYNLGVYSADLSYASLFDQNQIVINYMATSKKLAEELGILEAFDQETIKALEENVNNRDEVMRIISESFMDSDAYLQENQRHEIGAMILIGGWVEGVYIAVKLSDGDPNSNIPLASSILEQQLSLELMVQFLNDFNSGNSQLATMKTDLTELYDVYNSLETNVTNDGYLTVSKAEFLKVCEKIEALRSKIVKLS